MIEQRTRLKVIELRAQGISYDKIASRVGIAKQTVFNVCKSAPDEIAAIKSIEVQNSLSHVKEIQKKRNQGLLMLEDFARKTLESSIKEWRKDRFYSKSSMSRDIQDNIKMYLKILKEMGANTAANELICAVRQEEIIEKKTDEAISTQEAILLSEESTE